MTEPTDAQIQAMADEAERGYDPAELLRLADTRPLNLDAAVERGAAAVRLVAAQCSVCHVAYVDDYEGPCQEPAGWLTDAQLAAGDTRKCPGQVCVQPEDVARAVLEAAFRQSREHKGQ